MQQHRRGQLLDDGLGEHRVMHLCCTEDLILSDMAGERTVEISSQKAMRSVAWRTRKRSCRVLGIASCLG